MNQALLFRQISFSALLMFLSIQFSFSQQTVGKETLAIEYFQQGNFEKALPIFAKLAQSYPDNAMYNYYYGVSLIKNNIFETAAKEALLNSVVDKTPANANFYLAIYFHALENWDEAKDFYDRYAKLGNKGEKKSLHFDDYVALCEQKNNPFKSKKTSDPGLFGDSLLKPPPKMDEKIFPVPEALKKSWFNFQVNEILAYHSIDDFKSEASKILFTKAWICTGKNDSILTLTDSLRKAHDRIARVDTRLGIVQQIVDCEQKSYQIMRDREKFLEQSRVKESAYWEREGIKAANEFNTAILEREAKLNEEKKKAALPPVTAFVPEETKEPVEVESEKIQPAADTPVKLAQSENLIYKVKIGAFKNGIMSPTFKQSFLKISKLRKIDKYTDERKLVTYTVGNFSNSQDASKMKDQLIREGMKGSMVVPFDKITGKPAKSQSIVVGGKIAEPNTVGEVAASSAEKQIKSSSAENLIFKIQIGSFKNDLQPTAFRKAKLRISKQMKVDKYIDSKNYSIYTVGQLTDYQEAVKLKNKLLSEGLRGAYVSAFLNGERIKVADAIKIADGK